MSRRFLSGMTLALCFLGACELIEAQTACSTCAFRIADTTLLAGSVDQEIPILVSNDIILYGLSVGIESGSDALQITDDVRAGTATESADFFEGGVRADGLQAGYGVVYDLGGDFSVKHLPPGTDAVLITLRVSAAADTDAAVPLDFQQVDVPAVSQAPIKNVMTDSDGKSVVPQLDGATVTIETRRPEIAAIDPNQGLAGETIRVTGAFFDEPNLQVRVCDQVVGATLVDPATIEVMAPDCATEGCVEVEVCTDRGCASEPQGFCYQVPPPVITGFQGNSGPAGTQFTIQGENFDQPGLVVRVCDAVAEHAPPGDGGTTLSVTAPDCDTADCVLVEVSTDGGTDSDARGFCYSGVPPVITEFQDNSGPSGTEFLIIGENFDFAGLTVRVCAMEAVYELVGTDGTTLRVAAPHCDTTESGPVEVEVCTDFGCDSDPAGFDYVAAREFRRGDANNDEIIDLSDAVAIFGDLFLGNPAKAPCRDALDANDDGAVDISDGVWVLNFLFQGGPAIRPPYPDPGVDPTPDDLPDC